MGAPMGNRNRARHTAATALVANYLDAQGIATTTHARPSKISEGIGDVRPDIDAEGLAVTVTSRVDQRLSPDLDSAVVTARLSGAGAGALVMWRSQRDISEAYAVLTLADFAKLIRLARPS